MLIDISYGYDDNISIYPNNPNFHIQKVSDMNKEDICNVSKLSLGTHTGTHIDAPYHFINTGTSIEKIPLEKMNGIAKVICIRDPLVITQTELEKYEIEKEDIILFKTQNSLDFYGDRILDDYVTLDYKAAEYLVKKEINMVGIDYMTIERPRSKRVEGNSIHNILLSKNVLICEMINFENVAIEQGDMQEYKLICMPLKIVNGDGSPVRLVLEADRRL